MISTLPAWHHARRVLAVRLDALGDVLMTTPALRAIRASLPDGQLALLTSPAGGTVAEHIPEVDETIVASVSWMKATSPGLSPDADLALVERLRDGRFDGAVIFTVHTQSPLPAALVCRLAGIPLRLAHCRENPYGLLTDWVPEPETDGPTRHEVERQLALVRTVGFATPDATLSFRVPPDAARRVRALVSDIGIGRDSPWVILHPGASAPSRRYAPDRFVAAACELVAERWRIVVTGSEEERGLVDRIVRGIGPAAVSLAGRLSVGELGALIALAPVLVSNNSGPVHLAAAVGTPVVDVYALTNVQHTPWAVPHRVLNRPVPCAGCLRSICPLGTNACLDVDPVAVATAARALALGQSPDAALSADHEALALKMA